MGPDSSLERRKLRAGRRSAYNNLRCGTFLRDRPGPSKSSDSTHRAGAQRQFLAGVIGATLLLGAVPLMRADKLSFDERMEIERGLDAEFATMKVLLPRAKKPLILKADGSYDKSAWEKALQEGGTAARLGDEVQITRVEIEDKRILLELNGGTKSGGHWYDHVQVGMGGTTSPVGRNQSAQAANGSHIAIVFPSSVPSLKAADIRQMLSPIFDFEKHSAAQQYMDTLPEPMKKAIKEQRAIEGMNKDQVLLALGKPRNKSRETNGEGDEIEDWIYGDPPGKVLFVRFDEGKVVKVSESYANVGGSTMPPLPPPR
jgi:hypothetical protein